jgi:hypothetical protein
VRVEALGHQRPEAADQHRAERGDVQVQHQRGARRADRGGRRLGREEERVHPQRDRHEPQRTDARHRAGRQQHHAERHDRRAGHDLRQVARGKAGQEQRVAGRLGADLLEQDQPAGEHGVQHGARLVVAARRCASDRFRRHGC